MSFYIARNKLVTDCYSMLTAKPEDFEENSDQHAIVLFKGWLPYLGIELEPGQCKKYELREVG